MTANNDLTARLGKGEIIFLDGGIGTELERLGAPMDHDTWCAVALQTHPHLVKDVHRSYINAGADVIKTGRASCRKEWRSRWSPYH